MISLNCCNNKDNDNKLTDNPEEIQFDKRKHKGPMSHIKMMAVCCGAPVLLLLLLPLLGLKGGIFSNLIFLICPIMMVAMIPMMLRGHKNEDAKNVGQPEVKSIEDRPLL